MNDILMEIAKDAATKMNEATGKLYEVFYCEKRCENMPLPELLNVVAKSLCMDVEDYKNKSRGTDFVSLRNIAALLAKTYCAASDIKISTLTGMDRSTITSGRANIQRLLDNHDPSVTLKFKTATKAISDWFELRFQHSLYY